MSRSEHGERGFLGSVSKAMFSCAGLPRNQIIPMLCQQGKKEERPSVVLSVKGQTGPRNVFQLGLLLCWEESGGGRVTQSRTGDGDGPREVGCDTWEALSPFTSVNSPQDVQQRCESVITLIRQGFVHHSLEENASCFVQKAAVHPVRGEAGSGRRFSCANRFGHL